MEGGEGYAEVNGVIFNGGLDGVGFEDCILLAPGQWGALRRGWGVSLTMARTLDRSQAVFHVRQVKRTENVRPYLTTLLWDNGEAQLLVVELEPDIFAQR